MAKNPQIILELKNMKSFLADHINEPVYKVPSEYFENFPSVMLQLLDAGNEEILSQQLSTISNNPFSAPEGYFDTLAENILDRVKQNDNLIPAAEEIAAISPLLSGISKQMPYPVPAGYFENNFSSINKEPAKVVAFNFTRKNWFRYAAAAIVIGIISISGFLYFNQSSKIDPSKNPEAWVKNNTKKITTDELESFIELSNIETAALQPSIQKPVNSGEMEDLMEDVPDTDIQKFLNETSGVDGENDILLN
jgi:hypothetical protein